MSDFDTLTVRVPPPLHRRLKALAAVRELPLWALLAMACESYLAAQDAATRARVARVARQSKHGAVGRTNSP